MALKDTWVDRKNGIDLNSANDINQVARAVIELENSKVEIAQEKGNSEQKVMSQKTVTDLFDSLSFVSPKYRGKINIINNCQNIDDWRGSAIVDTTNFIIGTQSLNCNSSMRSVAHKYNMKDNYLIVKFKINSIASGASLYLEARNSQYANRGIVYELIRGADWTVSEDWQEVAIPYTAFSYHTSGVTLDDFDLTAIDDLTFKAAAGAVDWNLQYIGLMPRALKRGIVTFTFDDGYKSQYNGVKILAEKGITSTVFHIMSATGETYETGKTMTLEDLQSIVNHYGTNIEVHGATRYDELDEETLLEEWNETQLWLKLNGLGEGKHCAYPNGIFPDNVVQLARGFFQSCRTITPFIPLETFPPVDRYRMRAVSGISENGVMNIEKVKKYIDNAVMAGAWLILVFHKIGEGTGDTMDCSEEGLKTIADYAINSGAYIMNYAEVFESGAILEK